MKKIFQNTAVAWSVLILAVLAAVVLGQMKKPAALAEVAYGTWICDEADMLSSSAEKALTEYNQDWNRRYNAVIAVAAVDSIKGWEPNEYADSLGKRWGLGDKDMLLLLYPDKKGVNYWVSLGTYLQDNGRDTQLYAMKTAVENVIYSAGAEEGALALFRQADVFYAQVLGRPAWNQVEPDGSQWRERSGVSVFKVILLVGAIFAVWALLDRVRYDRYRRRSAVNAGTAAVSYYPIFWGRPTRSAPPPRQSGVYHSPASSGRPSGTYYAGRTGGQRPPEPSRPANRPPTPPRPGNTAKPNNTNRPSGFGKGGFGGGKR